MQFYKIEGLMTEYKEEENTGTRGHRREKVYNLARKGVAFCRKLNNKGHIFLSNMIDSVGDFCRLSKSDGAVFAEEPRSAF